MIKAGEYTTLPLDINCYEGVELEFGKWCSIGSGLKIYSGTHACINHPEVVSTFAFAEVCGWDYPPSVMDGTVTVGNDVWIATDVTILAGVTIGDGAIIAAGSMVTKDVPPYAMVAGNPARVKHYRFSKPIVKRLLEIGWWDWKEDKIKEAMPYMNNINEFIRRFQ